jgi:hypothetical protein
MAKTKAGKKIVHVGEYKRDSAGGQRKVRPIKTHARVTYTGEIAFALR